MSQGCGRLVPMTQTAKEQVRKLIQSDLKVRDIALVIGITTQRVYQILDELRREESEQEASA